MRDSRWTRDGGFTLIELLVVVIIIGILAAIAIPVYLNQRRSARDGAVKSDLRNAATAQVAYQLDDRDEYAGDIGTLSATVKFGPSQGVVFDQIKYEGGNRFCMVAHHSANGTSPNYWYFDSDDPSPKKAADQDHCTTIHSGWTGGYDS